MELLAKLQSHQDVEEVQQDTNSTVLVLIKSSQKVVRCVLLSDTMLSVPSYHGRGSRIYQGTEQSFYHAFKTWMKEDNNDS